MMTTPRVMVMAESLRCRGMRDLLPEEMTRFRRLEAAFRQVCEAWGFQEVRTPTIEHLWLFTAAGTLSPRMLGRVYSFLDWDGWSGERVVLRPDATISTARLYIENLSDQPLARLYYVQNVFRFAEGDESGEDWQCGVELIGDGPPLADVGLILVGLETLQRLGLSPLAVRLSHPGLVRTVLARAGFDVAQQLQLYDRILDGELAALREVEQRLPQAGASLDLLLGGEGESSAYLANIRGAFQTAIPELAGPIEELMAVTAALEELGWRCRIAAALVRNFEYYTGPVFRFSVGGRDVGGGGRYDSLVELVGGKSVAASGFALDVNVLMELLVGQLESPARESITVLAAKASPQAMAAAFRAASALRERGWPVQVSAADRVLPGVRWRLTVDGDSYTLAEAGSKMVQRFESLETVLAALDLACRQAGGGGRKARRA